MRVMIISGRIPSFVKAYLTLGLITHTPFSAISRHHRLRKCSPEKICVGRRHLNKPSHGIIVSAVFSVLLIGLMYTLGNLQSIICFRFRSVSVSVSVVVAVAVGINARFVRRYVCGV
jgi:hypothetical protein